MASGGENDLGAAVFDAASSGDVSRLKELLRFKRFSKIRGSLSWRDAFERTPLMAAAATGHADMVRLLVGEYGVNVEESKVSVETGEEFTALVYASNVGHDKVVKILLEHCARVDHAFPLHRACFASSAGNLKCVKLLVEHGADVNRKYNSGRPEGEIVDEGTALGVACEQLCVKIVEYLLEKGADPNIANKLGNSPLHVACDSEWYAHSERNCRGSCERDGKKVVQMLLDHGATQSKNSMELTPVMLLALTGNLHWFAEEESMFTLSPQDRIVVLELLASHLLLNSSQDAQKGYATLFKAKELAQPPNGAENATESPSPYGDYKEPSNCEELEKLKSDRVYLQVVALMIRGRILSMEGKKYYLWQAIRDFSDRCPRTPEGRQLALKALKYETGLEIESGFFCGFAVESLLRHLDPSQVRIGDSVLEDLVILLKLAAVNLSPHVSEMHPDSRKEAISYQRFKSTTIAHLLALYANYPALPEEDKEPLLTMIHQFVAAFNMASDVILELRRLEGKDGPPLGLSMFHVYFPVVTRRRPTDNVTERMITFLLKCGVDPCQVSLDGYNTLHHFVKKCPAALQTETFRRGIVVPLAEWGCPIMQKNPLTGRNAIDDCTNPETKQLLLDLALPSLLKLTARVIRKKRISYTYKGLLPASVTSLLDMKV